MKALTGLPTQAYLQVCEEAKVPLADLLRLVQQLEKNESPAFVARYRPDVSAGLDEGAIRKVRERLRSFLDLADRRITILTSLRQQNRLSDDLRKQIDEAMDRRALEDLYLPYKPKRRGPADDALQHGLEGLARFLWTQEPPDADLQAEASKYLSGNGSGPASSPEALEGAREIVARWLGENPEIRRDLRKLALTESEVVVDALPEPKRLSPKEQQLRLKLEAFGGKRLPTAEIEWRNMLLLRRGMREGLLKYEVALPENRIVEYLVDRMARNEESEFSLQLGAAAYQAYRRHIQPALENEVRQQLDDRCDEEAIQAFSKNLRRGLMAAPAGAVRIIGLEYNRPGGWRAAVLDENGTVLETAIVKEDPNLPQRESKANEKQTKAGPKPAKAEEQPLETTVSAPVETAKLTVESDTKPEEAQAPDIDPVSAESVVEEAKPAEEATAETLVTNPVAAEPEPPAVEEQAVEAAVSAPDETAKLTAESDSKAEEAGGPVVEPVSAEPAAEEAKPAEEAPAETPIVTADVAEPERPTPDEQPAAALTAAPDTAADPAVEEPVSAEAPPAEGAKPDGEAPAEASAQDPQAEQKADDPKPNAVEAAPLPDAKPVVAELSDLIRKHEVDLVVFANGPGARQVERFVRIAAKKAERPNAVWLTMSDSGTWIYATSRAARRELPQLDPAFRSAVSIARRCQDPLAELVKLDPRILGIGHGHQEVDQKRLRNALRATIEGVVHDVGIDVNRASAELIGLAAGMTERAAKRIHARRQEAGPFLSRQQLAQTQGLNNRVYDQAAGFLRVLGGENPLDGTGVHPKFYAKANELLQAAGIPAQEALETPKSLSKVELEPLADKAAPVEVLKAIIREFQPRVRKPRGEFRRPAPAASVDPIDELKAGMKVEGLVTNVTTFGAFVDIGAEQDGLVHVSQLSGEYVKDAKAAVKPGTKITVYVTAIERNGKRISLSTQEPRETSRQRRTSPEARKAAAARRDSGDRREGGRRESKGPINRTFGPDRAKRAAEEEQIRKLSVNEKLSLLGNRFRTKV